MQQHMPVTYFAQTFLHFTEFCLTGNWPLATIELHPLMYFKNYYTSRISRFAVKFKKKDMSIHLASTAICIVIAIL